MPRYIDADELINKLNSDDSLKHARGLIKLYVKEQPTADVKPVIHAKWDYWSSSRDSGWECSNCEKDSPCEGAYCPNCGARMECDTNEIT